jgi:WD40 repeat protein
VYAVAFSPDGRTALTGSDDGTARLWDVAFGKLLATLRNYGDVRAVAFSPDGRTALTGSADIFNMGAARLWTLPLPVPEEPARVRAWVRVRARKTFDEKGKPRDLTHAEWLEECRQLDALGGDWQQPTDPRVGHLVQAIDAESRKR